MMRRQHTNVLAAAALMLAALVPASSSAQTATRGRRTASPPPQSSAQPREAQPQSQPSQQAGDSADLSITARVTARELRFEKVPNPKVEFTGRPRRETVWEAERENLPEQVQPGVTYRDIGITLRITSVFADIERIVAEALGEIPPSDDAPPPEGAQPSTPAPQSAPPADAPTGSASDASPPKAPAAALRSTQRNRSARKGRGR